MAGNLHDETLEQLPTSLTPATPTPPVSTDPYEQAANQFLAERDAPQKDALRRALDTTPDRAADVRRLAESEGLPASVVERNYDAVKKAATLRAAPFAQLQQEAPKLATWLADPANMAIAQDDIEPLSALSKTLSHPHARTTERLLKVGRRLSAGLNEGFAGMFGTLEAGAAPATGAARPVGIAGISGFEDPNAGASPEVAAFAKGMRQEMSTIAAVARGPADADEGLLERGIYSGIESIGMMVPGFAASVATGSPAPMMGMLGASTFGASYGKATDAGIGHDRATAFAMVDAAVEVATEFIPAKWFFRDVKANAAVWQIIRNQLAGEVPGELIATTAQSLNDFMTLRPEEPLSTWRDELPSALAETVVATITMVGVMGAAGKVMTSLAGDSGRAKQAEQDKEFFADLAKGVKGSATIQRSPEAAETLLKELTDERVYLSPEALATYFQDKGIDTPRGRVEGAAAVAGELTGQADALAHAQKTGTDLEIPTSVYALLLAGTDHHAALADDLRRDSPERMTQREYQAFKAAEVAKAEEPEAEAEAEPAVDPVRQSILQKLQAAVTGTGAKVPAGNLERGADVFEAFTSTFEREGLDPVETLARYGVTIAGPQEQVAPAAPRVPFSAKVAELKAAQAAKASPTAQEAPGTTTAPEAPKVGPTPAGTPVPALTLEQAHIAALKAQLVAAQQTNRTQAKELRAGKRKAQVDTLTGVGSLEAYNQALPAAEADPGTSVVVFDANNFGDTNKIIGQIAGDAMLKRVTAAILQAATEHGAGGRVFRRGGDEFVVLAPNEVAEEIARRASELFGIEDVEGAEGPVSLTGTAGATFETADLTLQKDKTLHKAVVQRLVDSNTLTRQAIGPRNAETGLGANRLIDQTRSPAGNRVPASDPGTGKKAAARHIARVFAAVLDSALTLDPAVDEAELKAEFDYLLDLRREWQALAAQSSSGPHMVLRALARHGGLSTDPDAERAAEIRQLFGGGPFPAFGAVAGIKGVFGAPRKGSNQPGGRAVAERGIPIDVMLQRFESDPDVSWVDSIDLLLDQVDEAMRHGRDEMTATELPGTEELRDIGIKREQAWWLDRKRPEVEADENPDDSNIPLGVEDEIDFTTLDQLGRLFDEDPALEPVVTYAGEQDDGEGGTFSLYTISGGPRDKSTVTEPTLKALGLAVPPKPGVDVLDTGEAQPRLFDEPAASQAPIADAPFALTSEIAGQTATKKLQRTLWQGLIESTETVQPKFYSRILRTVELSPQTKATGAQWAATIKNSKLGMNVDEFALTSVADLEPGRSYTKQEVLDYLSVHQVQVSEVILGGPRSTSEDDALRERAYGLYDREVEERREFGQLSYQDVKVEVVEFDDGTWGYEVDGEDGELYFQTEAEAQASANDFEATENERRRDAAEEDLEQRITADLNFDDFLEQARRDRRDMDDDDATEAQYEGYQLDATPGFEKGSYREAFVTAEPRPSAFDPAKVKIFRNLQSVTQGTTSIWYEGQQLQTYGDDPQLMPGGGYEQRPDSYWMDTARKLYEKGDKINRIAKQGDTWEDGHDAYSNVVNPIVRLRFATRIARVSLSDAEAAPLHAEAVKLEAQRAELSKQITDNRSTGPIEEMLARGQQLREQRDVVQSQIEALDHQINGQSRKLMFLEEVQPPQPSQQEAMPAIYLKNWREIAFKWALRYAADHGFDGVSWTTGDQQRARYSLRTEVDSILWKTVMSSEYEDATVRREVAIAVKRGGEILVNVDPTTGKMVRGGRAGAAQWEGKHLSEAVGKELAAKILEGEQGEIKEDGLEIGGFGLKRLYDVDFVNIVNKLPAVKANGGRVTQFDIGAQRDEYSVREVTTIGPRPVSEWIVDNRSGRAVISIMRHSTEAQARAHADELNAKVQPTLQPGLEFTPELKAAVLGGQTLFQNEAPDTSAFKTWFGDSKVVDEAGKPRVVYHGAKRADRVGSEFKKSRATSGPMPFFTDDPEVGGKYATGKADTSLEDKASYSEWFQFKPRGARSTVEINRAWFHLSAAERAEIVAKLPHVTKLDEAGNELPLGQYRLGGPTEFGLAGQDHWDFILKREARGNMLQAAVDVWLDSGGLFDAEADFMKILELGGMPMGRLTFDDPHAERSAVFPVYLSIQNPLVTNAMPPEVIAAIEKRSRRQRVPKDATGADLWDKNLRNPREWVQQLKDDTAAGKNSMAWTSIPDWVTDTLKGLGYDGIHDTGGKMGGVEHSVWIPFEPPQIKSATGNRGTFSPDSPNILHQDPTTSDKKRGGITSSDWGSNAFFGPGLEFTIKLFEKMDATTFTHESAHLFLKIMEDLAARPEATDSIKRDLGLLNDWFFGKGNTGTIGRAEHERFANAFNVYLSEGRAPSLKLRKVFEDFRKWFLRFTTELLRYDVKLTDDVRGVFDRMLASDAAIAEAQAEVKATPMFTTPESARMSAEEFEVYQDKIAEAGLEARKTLEGKLLRDLQKQQRADYRAAKEEIRQAVQAEVYAMPVYQALAAMRKGTHPDGTPLVEGVPLEPLRLSRQVIVERYGPGRLAALPSYPPPIHASVGGMDPDTVAELFGFASGDALLHAVAAAHPMRGLIEAETTKRMTAQAGDLVVDNKLSGLARAAVANEHREAIVRIEMQTLGRLQRTAQAGAVKERDYERRWFEAEAKLRIAIAEGRTQAAADAKQTALSADAKAKLAEVRQQKRAEIDALEAEVSSLKAQARGGAARINAALPSDAELREIAKVRIGRTRVRDLRPELFHTAARRAGQLAFEAGLRQEWAKALAAKQQEMISLALYREASRVVEDVEARVRAAQKLDAPASRKRIGLAGGSYQDQIDAVLERYQFARLSNKALTKREALRAWVAGLEADGFSVDLPDDVLDDAKRTHYRELTVDELTGVTDGLTMIVHLARLKARLLKNKDARDFAVERDKLVTSIRKHTAARAMPLEFRPSDDRRRTAGEWFASHARIGTLAQVMDGPGDGGAMWSAIIRPINEAADAKATRNAAEGATYAAILQQHYPGRELGRWSEQVHIPALNASLSKEARLSVALNWGNQTSRDRLLNDPQRKWNQKQISAILDTLDERDWKFVQDTWRFLDRFWPEIAAKTHRLTGVEPERVEGIPVVTKFGTFAGGYYPLAYDPRLNIKSQQHEAATEAKLKTSAAYVRTTTRRGHLEARQQNVKLSVRLDLGVMFSHLEQVIHDLTHHEMLIDVTRLLRDPAVSNAILETKGDVIYQQFTRALEAIAAGKLDPAKNGMEKAATFARTGTQIALLGFNLWTGIQQPLGLFNGAERVGARWVAKGLATWLKNPARMRKTVEWIHSVSPFMATRSSAATQDLADLRTQLRTSGGWFDTAVRTVTADVVTQQHVLDSFLWHIGLMQQVADVPTWLGQYEKSRAAGETEARAVAIADQTVIDSQGSGRISDLSQVQRGGPVARLFLTFYSYGSATYNAAYRRAGQTSFKSPAQVAAFVAGLSLIYVLPSMATVLLRQAVGKGGDDDDDEEWVASYMADVGRESLSSALNGMVWIRELSQIASEGTRGYAGPAGARALQLMYRLAGQAKQGELDEALLKALNQVGGVFLRYPSAQLERTLDGWAALEAGDTSNPAALLFGPPK